MGREETIADSAPSRLDEVYLKVMSLFCEFFLKESFQVLAGKEKCPTPPKNENIRHHFIAPLSVS